MRTIDQLFSTKLDTAMFHDTVVSATDWSFNDEELRSIFKALPYYIRSIAYEWGLSDTVFRDNAHIYLKRAAASR